MPNIFNFEKISNYKSQRNPQFALPVNQMVDRPRAAPCNAEVKQG